MFFSCDTELEKRQIFGEKGEIGKDARARGKKEREVDKKRKKNERERKTEIEIETERERERAIIIFVYAVSISFSLPGGPWLAKKMAKEARWCFTHVTEGK